MIAKLTIGCNDEVATHGATMGECIGNAVNCICKVMPCSTICCRQQMMNEIINYSL